MKAENENLLNLIFDNRRQYQIPVYQRNYDWKKNNCIDLYNDILNAYHFESKHFLGTIVQVQLDEENGIKRYIVIDGQQRLTSIYLLLKAMYDFTTDEADKIEISQLLYNFSSSKQYNKDEKSKLKLKQIKSDNEQFILLMNNKVESMDKSSNIYLNYSCFINLISKTINEGLQIKNILKGIKYLEIVMISLKEPGDKPQVIFERINSTGEDLTLADLIRNYLLMTNINMDELFEEFWLPMEKNVGKEDLNDYLINYLIYKLPDTINSKNAYQQFKRYAENIEKEEIMLDLKLYSKFYVAFTRNSLLYSQEINNLLSGYRALKQSTIYPFLFNVFKDFDDNIIDELTLKNVLKLFLNYTIRRAVTGVPTNSLRGLYKTLYKRIFTSEIDKNNYYENICRFLASINTKDALPNDTIFKSSLMTANLYINKQMCKYLLSIIENGLNSVKETVNTDKNITIEHIMPQNKDNEDWKNLIGDEFLSLHEKKLHTLGNLTLTGYNSELSDKTLKDKVSIIKNTSKFIKLNSDVVDKTTWNNNIISNRAERLSNLLLSELEFPNIIKKYIKAEDDILKFTTFNSNNITHTKPTSFILLGEKVDVNNYTDMLIKFTEKLFNLDETIIFKLAANNLSFEHGEKPLLSQDKSLLRTAKEINNTGIYIETNHSSSTTIKVIKIFLEKYDISEDEFLFYARINLE